MNKNLIIAIVVLIILLGVGYYFFTKYRKPSLTPELPQPPTLPIFQTSTLPEVLPTATSPTI